MSDISMCSGEGCPLRATCYRYTAEANDHWQSYFSAVPFKDGKCEYYWHRCKYVRREGESCNLNNKCTYPDCDTDGPLKPIHKFNDGAGATICNSCRRIISIGFTEDLFCDDCLKAREWLKTI